MLMHHFVALVLYIFSYMIRGFNIGGVVAYLHDWADIFSTSTRCLTELTLKKTLLASALMMLLTWLYTRIIMLPIFLYQIAIYDLVMAGSHFMKYFFLFNLGAMQILHIYWFILLVHKFVTYSKTGDDTDNQQKIK